jgi:hypothetical protein
MIELVEELAVWWVALCLGAAIAAVAWWVVCVFALAFQWWSM